MKRRPPSTRGGSIDDAVTGQFHRDSGDDDTITRDFGASAGETEIGVPPGVDLQREGIDDLPTRRIVLPEETDPDVDCVPVAHEPLQMISMKTPVIEGAHKPARDLPPVKAPTMSALKARLPTGGMGNLAPPRDAREVRARRMRDFVLWSCLVVALASLVSIAIWLLAAR